MDTADSFSSYPHQDSSVFSKPPSSGNLGLKIVLPGLKGGKVVVKGGKKSKNGPYSVHEEERKLPRPVRLKPLKEVLAKLIAQIQKKDDYAFFLKPVNVSQVPGYLDVVKRPMDLGTMSTKVSRGKYRSLEDFASDLRLVTGNAKAFNPPGTIYYTEAERIETWALDHLQKASATVIQYETDWNIDVEKDDEFGTVNVEDDDDLNANVGTPMDLDEPGPTPGGRSPSVMSQVPAGPSRRSARTVTKKAEKTEKTHVVSESVDAEGRLPGSRDGLGAFLPGSDWARTMLALKIKGKKYKTKKERLQREKEGPPFLADGSLDYTEMEDPFSFLSFFAPEPVTRPYLTPLYPPLFSQSSIPGSPSSLPQSHPDSQAQTPRPGRASTPALASSSAPPATYPTSTSIPLDFTLSSAPPAHLLVPGYTCHPPYLTAGSTTGAATTSMSVTSYFSPVTASSSTTSKRKHWTITRNATRGKQKEKEVEADGEAGEGPAWQVPREAHTFDFGSYAGLVGALEDEIRKRGVRVATAAGIPNLGQTQTQVENGTVTGEEEQTLEVLRESIKRKPSQSDQSQTGIAAGTEEYWSDARAVYGEDYVRDVVYGGVEGLAYVRSLAEFVSPGEKARVPCPDLEGLTLAEWVEREIVDTLTEGRHQLLRQAAIELAHAQLGLAHPPSSDELVPSLQQTSGLSGLRTQVWTSLHVYPSATATLASLLQIGTHKIDMAALIRAPEELFESENEWVGRIFRERRRKPSANLQGDAGEDKGGSQQQDAEQPGTGSGVKAEGEEAGHTLEGPEELGEVMDYVMGVILDLDRKMREGGKVVKVEDVATAVLANGTSTITPAGAGGDKEDPALRDLRLNLLALAKRAPLDTIARLPPDLVPEHIRQFVPTLGG